MLSNISPINKASIIALGKNLEHSEHTNTIAEFAGKYGISLMSENRNRQNLLKKIVQPSDSQCSEDEGPRLLKSACEFIGFLMQKGQAYRENTSRLSYEPWFKEFLIKQQETTLTYSEISQLTGIRKNTLKKFKAECSGKLKRKPITDIELTIAECWGKAPLRTRKNIDRFFLYFGKQYPDQTVSRNMLRQILIDLGLRYPRGPKIEDHGAQVKTKFAPHALWEGDGKNIKITINSTLHPFCWYAFCDQRSTLLVGADVGKTESSKEFLAALRAGKKKSGVYPIGVLIDNRFPDADISVVKSFCKEHGINLVRNFPGNSKTNGNIENNFSVFEKFVGDVRITGRNESEIARSIALAITEVFTQQRNHAPRKRLFGGTPDDFCQGRERPEEIRNAVEKLAQRFQKEERNIEAKWSLVKVSREAWDSFSQESEDKLKAELGKYPINDIIGAQACYCAQKTKHPEKYYGPEYFLAILRHKRETKAKQTYNETYRSGIELANELTLDVMASPEVVAEQLLSELTNISEDPSPSHKLLKLDAVCWWLVSFSPSGNLIQLWRKICGLAESALNISLKWWQQINEYISEKLSKLIYDRSLSSHAK